MSNFEKTISDGIAVLTVNVDGAPMNVLTEFVLMEFNQVLNDVINDDAVKGAVITSARKEFIVGADISMLARMVGFSDSMDAVFERVQQLSGLFRKMETSGKPFVAALNGDALGGGLEMALACHARIMSDRPGIKLGLPEVKLGLLPGAGGTQRLPRIIGAAEALKMMTTGSNLKADKALQFGLVSAVVPEDQLVETARQAILSGKVPAEQPWDQKGFRPPAPRPNTPAWVETFAGGNALLRKETAGNYPAPAAILSCVYHGMQRPIDSGLKIEARKFLGLITGTVSRAMIRTLWFGLNSANKLAARPKDLPKTNFTKIGVLGAGTMGAGIALVNAEAGIPTVLLDVSIEAAQRGHDYCKAYWTRQVEKGRIDTEKAQKLLSLVTPTDDYSALSGAELVIEAVFEDRKIKADVTAKAEAVMAETAVFGTNTSTLPITGLAKASSRPANFIGIHFFSPVEKMPLVELICGELTEPHAVAVAMDYVKAIRKTPIVVNDGRGFYTSRVVGTYPREAVEMLAEGYDPVVVENVGKATGMPMGPFELMDLVGIDVAYKIAKAMVAEEGMEAFKAMGNTDNTLAMYAFIVDEHGRHGQKNGKGCYEYVDGRKDRLWPELRARYAKADAPVDVDLIRKRFLTIQALETVRCMAEGVLTTPRDADIGSILGWGFAPWTGGTISYVNDIGIDQFIADCEMLEKAYGPRFAVPQMLRDMAAKGETFYKDPAAALKAA